MTATSIPVDQRLIGVDSRRFASVDKALVELITNCDDSYSRARPDEPGPSGSIRIVYERHAAGTTLEVTDRAEGIAFGQAATIVAYGSAHSPLARGEGTGRGYVGRGLKQAVFGLGHGRIESVLDGRLTTIDLFRDTDGTYLFDDHGSDRAALDDDRRRLGIPTNGTRVTIVVADPATTIPHYKTLLSTVADNVYLREVLARRLVDLVHVQSGREVERCERVRHLDPPARTLIGPDRPGTFVHDGVSYGYRLTLRSAEDTELTLRRDDRTNGLVVVSGPAVLDCQFFEHENQVGTEYLFGTLRCPVLTERLGAGEDVIGDDREGLNPRHPLVAALSRAVSAELAGPIAAQRAELRHLEHATTSHHTGHAIDRLLLYMSEAAGRDLGVSPGASPAEAGGAPAPLRFATVHLRRRPGRPVTVELLVDRARLDPTEVLTLEGDLPASMRIEPAPAPWPVGELPDGDGPCWTLTGDTAGARGRLTARAGRYWARCEVVVDEPRPPGPVAGRRTPSTVPGPARPRVPRDHGEMLFEGYDLCHLHDEGDRAVYDPARRRVLINTGAPTVQLYLDGRGHFRDSARLLLAELFLEVIAEELARRSLHDAGRAADPAALQRAEREIVRRYGADVHRFFA